MMRRKKAILNIITSMLLQVITIICGFIVPRLIIIKFGSSVNGLVSSIGQFLGYITLLEAGVGGVVRAALYKPLAKKDIICISEIIKATETFFKKLAFIYVGYLLVIMMIYPLLVKGEFNTIYTFTLILIIGIFSFVQYYFGISYQLLLHADQRLYINTTLNIFTTIINTVLVVILIKLGVSIHIVKLGSSIIFAVRPILLNIYVKKKYKLIKNVKSNNSAIKQRWDGLGHHIAFFLHSNTDIVVLTLFSNIKEVSVYTIYLMVISGIEKIIATFSSGLEATFGNMIAKDETDTLNKTFEIFDFISFTITTILFTSTALLILPFVTIYTKGVTDVNYYRPIFAYVLILAEAVYCVRLPYHTVVIAAGHYKQTRNGAFAEAIINIVLSVILINYFGIVGVAIGTLCAMLFRTFQYAKYLSKNILKRSFWIFIKRIVISILNATSIILIANTKLSIISNSYIIWCIYAIKVMLLAIIVVFSTNIIFYSKDIKILYEVLKRKNRNMQVNSGSDNGGNR